jgi:prepilin-type N-terminal cleavage/methylation domain-containing protein
MRYSYLKKPQKGMTLVEIMIYSALVGIILTGVYATLIFSMRYFKTINTLSSLQDSVLVTLSKMEMEMSETRAASITISESNPPGVMFPTLKNLQGNYTFSGGQVLWQAWTCYYLQKNDEESYNLVMKKVNLSSPRTGNPGEPPFPSVAAFAASSSAPPLLVSRNVNMLKVTPGSTIYNYRISITAECNEDKSKPNKITAETELMFRN